MPKLFKLQEHGPFGGINYHFAMKLVLRALHVISMAIVFGVTYFYFAYVTVRGIADYQSDFGAFKIPLHALIAAIASGLLLMAREEVENRRWFRQPSGIIIGAKILLLIATILFFDYSIYLLTVVLILGVTAAWLPTNNKK